MSRGEGAGPPPCEASPLGGGGKELPRSREIRAKKTVVVKILVRRPNIGIKAFYGNPHYNIFGEIGAYHKQFLSSGSASSSRRATLLDRPRNSQ